MGATTAEGALPCRAGYGGEVVAGNRQGEAREFLADAGRVRNARPSVRPRLPGTTRSDAGRFMQCGTVQVTRKLHREASVMERIPAVIAAGDRKAAKAIHGRSKAYLELGGQALVTWVVRLLQRVPEVSEVWVVGDAQRLEAVLSREQQEGGLHKPLVVAPQYRNLLENAWQSYRRMLPGAPATGRDPVSEEEQRRPVLYLSADLPFATPEEVSAFVREGLALNCDYVLGLAAAKAFADFGPSGDKPGIEMAFFHTADGLFRQNNLHLVRPARIGNRGAIEEMYEHRYQKQLGQMLGLAWRILSSRGGGPLMLIYYALMHLALTFDRMGLKGFADWTRRGVAVNRVERACSSLLGAHFRLLVVETGGAAIDIDNEHDLDVARMRFEEWTRAERQRARARYGAAPAPASEGGGALRVLAPAPQQSEAEASADARARGDA